MSGTVPLLDQTLAGVTSQWPLIGHALVRHRTQRGEPLSFRERPYLVEMYVDAPRIGFDAVKAPQLGLTELFLQLALWEAGWRGRIIGYVLPTDRLRDRLVGTRVNPLLREVPAYRARLPGADLEDLRSGESGNLRAKRVGPGLLLFLGAKTDGDFVEFSADTLILDEYDLCVASSADNVAKATDRTRESKDPRHFRLGNAEAPRAGIERLFSEGDGRLWHWRCGRCRYWQALDWTASFVDRADDGGWVIRDGEARLDPTRDPRPCCLRCGRPFDRDPDDAAWVSARLGRDRRSYRLARWDRLKAGETRKAWDEWVKAQGSTVLLRAWWRGWAGLAWEPASGLVTADDLRTASVLDPMDHAGGEAYRGRTVTAGIDVGALINIVVSDVVRGPHGRAERRCRWVGTVTDAAGVVDVLRRYHVRTAVIDEGPEYRLTSGIRDAASREMGGECRVWLCHFHPTDRTGAEAFAMRLDWAASRVIADRTQLMDASADCIRAGAASVRPLRSRAVDRVTPAPADGKWPEDAVCPMEPAVDGSRLWPCDVDCALGFIEQVTASRRVMNDRGRIVWDEAGVPDHYRLADAYDLLAWSVDSQGAVVF